MNIIKGKAWKFGDDVNTDLISPTKYLRSPQEELKKHSLESLNPKFPAQVKSGDVIVAGNNFGCGSSRESAPVVLKALQVGAIVAESFARIFFRNAIAIGLPIIVLPRAASFFDEGDAVEVDIANATVINVTKKMTYAAQPLPVEMQEVLFKGGIEPMLREIAATQE
jgi:3-isopropylmalate/(R)-2-methylmalate dehydratase small subunit